MCLEKAEMAVCKLLSFLVFLPLLSPGSQLEIHFVHSFFSLVIFFPLLFSPSWEPLLPSFSVL